MTVDFREGRAKLPFWIALPPDSGDLREGRAMEYGAWLHFNDTLALAVGELLHGVVERFSRPSHFIRLFSVRDMS